MNTLNNPHPSKKLLALASLALTLSACSSPSHDSATSPAAKTAQQVNDFTKSNDAAFANIDPARLNPSTHPSPNPTPPLSPAPAAAHPFPVSAAPTITPIAGHSPGVPSALGTIPPPSPPPLPSESPTTAPATQPALAATPLTTAPSIPTPPTPPPTLTAEIHPLPPPSEPTLDQSMSTLRKQITAHPTLNTALALALLDNADGKSPDPAASAALSPTDQKLLSDILAALQSMTSAPSTSAARLSDRAAPLMNMAKSWQADADLTLPKLALASRVDSFGIYTPVPASFTQGTPHTVLIYCEVANFTSQKGDDGWYTTRLSQEETLLTDDGILAWRPNAEDVEDRSMNQRHDFYLVKKLTLPDSLAAGKYTLRMKVIDRNSNKIALVTMPLEITDK